jgi:hypothetical protein
MKFELPKADLSICVRFDELSQMRHGEAEKAIFLSREHKGE